MALNKGIWDPKPRVTSIKGTNLKALMFSLAAWPEHATTEPNAIRVMLIC